MKLTNTKNLKAAKTGMTLLELTVVILVLLSLISILFIGARAWKRGSDRAAAILQIRNVQQAVRSFANMNGKNAGDTITAAAGPPVVLALRDEIFGPGKFIENDPTLGTHPAGGTITYVIATADKIPDIGTLYMTSSDTQYAPSPDTTKDW